MNKFEDSFKDINEENIYYQYWLPDTEIKSVILIIHGLAEHSGRYMNIVNRFVPLGVAIYALDHIGHGKSDGLRGYVNRFSDYTSTIKVYLDMIVKRQKGKPMFILGHSMGGLISLSFLLSYNYAINGLILSSPSIKAPKKIPSMIIFVGKILSKIMPRFRLIKLTSGNISYDEGVADNYNKDPLVYRGKTTARLAFEIHETIEYVINKAGNIMLPLIIFQAGNDELVHPDGAKILLNKVNSHDKSLIIYDEMCHEVFNEKVYGKVLDDLQIWLSKCGHNIILKE